MFEENGKLSHEVKYMEISFENCESIIVPTNSIDDLIVYGIKSNFYHQVSSRFVISEHVLYSCELIQFSIRYKDDSDLIYDGYSDTNPLGMFVGNPSSNSVDDRPNILGRILNYNDITHVHFLDEKKEEILTISVPYEGDNENKLQKVEVDEGYQEICVRIYEKEDE